MFKLIDDFLNGITMYRLMLYFLIVLFLIAESFSLLGLLSFIDPGPLVFSAVLLVLACWITNKVLAGIFKVQTNLESVYISALILTLIMTPARSLEDALLLGLAGVFSQASKYLLVIGKKHIFNPAAVGVLASGIIFKNFASWWYGDIYLFPGVVLGGLLVARKIRRLRMVTVFILTTVFIPFLQKPFDPLVFQGLNLIVSSSLLFFTFVMLTEPLTSPKNMSRQFVYAILVGALAVSYPFEMALLVGNIFSFITAVSFRYVLKLKKKTRLSPDVFEFKFDLPKGLSFKAGQYLEWTLPHSSPDNRGVRRFFTIVSSSTEEFLALASKFYDKPSTFKQTLLKMQPGEKISAGELAGEFTLPKDPGKKLVFLAGGIGVTPYRSMIKYLLDTNQKRDIILFYLSKQKDEFIYRDVFNQALKNVGLRTVYAATDEGEKIDKAMIERQVPDCKERFFYISGPHGMVEAFKKICQEMGVPSNQIKVDFFPGYA